MEGLAKTPKITKGVGKRIKARRLELGLSQADFASQLGFTQPYLSTMENGLKQPSVPILMAIAFRFGGDMQWWFRGRG